MKADTKTCTACGGDTEGYKCEMCGSEADKHDAEHECGGEHCTPKCKECNESQAQCTCG
jgi:hypothetical protein